MCGSLWHLMTGFNGQLLVVSSASHQADSKRYIKYPPGRQQALHKVPTRQAASATYSCNFKRMLALG
jgi:hypothetical protein